MWEVLEQMEWDSDYSSLGSEQGCRGAAEDS